ncbi:unnamed protein product [Peniophora sp. CBMAI 1063]|nr:unnamed protein product [Peniophora sp. CBMAI 1063]
MGAVDPTYPLFTVASLISSVMLLMVLASNTVRQSWNLGLTLLCFWLFLGSIANAIDSIVWSDNYDVKLYVWCDIDSRLELIVYFVKPMATLIISRRLYLIVSLQSVEPPSIAAKRWDLAVEWGVGLVIPLLIAGPIYYINQSARFEIIEGFGCADTSYVSILEVLIEESWGVLPPLVSVIFYYPKLVRTYLRQRKDVDRFLRSNSSVSHSNYLRILAIATIDILLTLPIGIVNITMIIVAALAPPKDFPFYPGWEYLHADDWEPGTASYADMTADGGVADLAQIYFTRWTSPVLAFTIFALFGVTSEARGAYWRILCSVGGRFGWKPTAPTRKGQNSLGEIEFGAAPRATEGADLEIGSHTPSFFRIEAVPAATDMNFDEKVHREDSSGDTDSQAVRRSKLAIGESWDAFERSDADSADLGKEIKEPCGDTTREHSSSGEREDVADVDSARSIDENVGSGEPTAV